MTRNLVASVLLTTALVLGGACSSVDSVPNEGPAKASGNDRDGWWGDGGSNR